MSKLEIDVNLKPGEAKIDSKGKINYQMRCECGYFIPERHISETANNNLVTCPGCDLKYDVRVKLEVFKK